MPDKASLGFAKFANTLSALRPLFLPRYLDIGQPAINLFTMSANTKTAIFPATVPEHFERTIEMTRAELDHHLRLMAALKMFELGQISSGKAADLVGTTRVDFLQTCGRYHVSIFNYPPDEAEAEIRRELEVISQLASA